MKAILFNEYGGPDVLFVGDAARSSPAIDRC